MTQSQSNTGTRSSRPQAWAKNVISVGVSTIKRLQTQMMTVGMAAVSPRLVLDPLMTEELNQTWSGTWIQLIQRVSVMAILTLEEPPVLHL